MDGVLRPDAKKNPKIFGEPKLSDGTLARLGRNEGVRRMETAERAAVVGSPDLESLNHERHRARVSDSTAGIEAVSAQGTGLQQKLGRAQAGSGTPFRSLQLCTPTSQPWNDASRGRWP